MKLGLGFVFGVVATLAAVGVIVVLTGGRDSKRNIPARPASGTHVIYTLRQGNVVRDPLTSARCEASGEGGKPNLFCTRTARGRYQFVFYSDAVLVFDLQKKTGDPLVFKWIARKP